MNLKLIRMTKSINWVNIIILIIYYFIYYILIIFLVLSFCRIYTNVLSADGYKKLFSTLFDVIQELTNEPLSIYHIHGKGWECILGDLDSRQAKGLGLALYELDPSKDWETHLTYIFKSCVIHFQRLVIYFIIFLLLN